jgi:hypothetical protein
LTTRRQPASDAGAPVVACPSCGAKLKLGTEAWGKRGRCPQCQARFAVADLNTLAEPQPTGPPPAEDKTAADPPTPDAAKDQDTYNLKDDQPTAPPAPAPTPPPPEPRRSPRRTPPPGRRVPAVLLFGAGAATLASGLLLGWLAFARPTAGDAVASPAGPAGAKSEPAAAQLGESWVPGQPLPGQPPPGHPPPPHPWEKGRPKDGRRPPFGKFGKK